MRQLNDIHYRESEEEKNKRLKIIPQKEEYTSEQEELDQEKYFEDKYGKGDK
jgi:hypothetical protein